MAVFPGHLPFHNGSESKNLISYVVYDSQPI